MSVDSEIADKADQPASSPIESDIGETERWLTSPRFAGLTRLYSAHQVVEQRGTIATDHTIARVAAEQFYNRLRQLFAERTAITTFGPYSPGQAVAIKRMGIEGIYLGGWATSAKGSVTEDPGPDLASYPLSQVPDEAAPIVRALLTADRNQRFARSRMTEAQRAATPETDYRPFIIADADTGHGGDAHVQNLIRRFAEVGVPGYHIEDQKPGAKKCGHQGGKVLVGADEQIKRLSAARFQLDIMRVPGIIVARTDAESATFLDGRSDERDHPFILGATNTDLPTYKVGYLTILRKLHELGVQDARGHLLYQISAAEYDEAATWLERAGVMDVPEANAKVFLQRRRAVDRRAAGEHRDALPGGVAGRGQPEELPAGGRGRDRVPRQRGRAVRHGPPMNGWLSPTGPRTTTPGPRPGRWASASSGTARRPRPPMATTRYKAASTTPSPSRWLSRRSPICCGWRPRPRTWRTHAASPRPSTASSRTRCSPTTCPRRSTGTPPG